MEITKLKVAVVYDWLDRWGGVERVLLALHDLMPQSHYYTSVYNPQKAAWAKSLPIKTSFLQHLPGFIRNSRVASVLFYPLAFESFNFNRYDLVLSVSSSFAKSVITKPEIPHICYLLTPSRYLWLYPYPLERRIPAFAFKPYQSYMKEWDLQAAQRPDTIVSISQTVAKRCRDIYGRESQMVYPPFDTGYWEKLQEAEPAGLHQSEKAGYYLTVSRLEPYKRVDLVVKTFAKRPRDRVIIVGSGSQLEKLKQKATGNITFFGSVSEGELKWLYRHAKALIMPQEEDFGYVSLEAQQFGTPVIAFGRGGAAETVVQDKTGILFPEQSESSLSSTLERFDKISYNFRHDSRSLGHWQAEKYSKDIFNAQMTKIITNSVLEARKNGYVNQL